MDAIGNESNASMPEEVKRLNPLRKMMMMTIYSLKKVSNFFGHVTDSYIRIFTLSVFRSCFAHTSLNIRLMERRFNLS